MPNGQGKGVQAKGRIPSIRHGKSKMPVPRGKGKGAQGNGREGGAAASPVDSIVKLKRTFVEHERLLASDMFITTHVAPDANTVAEAVNARMSGEHCVSAPAQLLYRVSASSEGAQLLRSDSTASTAATAPALGARSPQQPLIEASRVAPKRSASDAGHGPNRRSSRRLG